MKVDCSGETLWSHLAWDVAISLGGSNCRHITSSELRQTSPYNEALLYFLATEPLAHHSGSSYSYTPLNNRKANVHYWRETIHYHSFNVIRNIQCTNYHSSHWLYHFLRLIYKYILWKCTHNSKWVGKVAK